MKKTTLLLLAAAAMCTQVFAQTKVRNLYTSTEKLNLAVLEQENTAVQLNRTLLAGYNTICLPFTLNASQLAESAKDVQVERLVSVRQEGSTLYMYFLDCTKEGIQAGMPYLIYSPTTQTLRAKSTEAEAVNTELKSVSMTDAMAFPPSRTHSSWRACLSARRATSPSCPHAAASPGTSRCPPPHASRSST